MKIKLKEIDRARMGDMYRLATRYLIVMDCPGGRPINDGYICPHCGADPSRGDCDGVEGFIPSEGSRE